MILPFVSFQAMQMMAQKLDSSNIVLSDRNAVLEKVQHFINGGKDELMVITDFDRTLTPYQNKESGELFVGSYGVLGQCPTLDAAFKKKQDKLFEKYFPYEKSFELSTEEKMPYMEEWWSKSNDLMIESKLRKEDIKHAANETNMVFREGLDEMFGSLRSHNVPVLIFSAGLADIIREVLQVKKGSDILSPNVHVISNLMKFDPQTSLLTGFEGDIIHVFNKNANVLHGSKFLEQCEERHNILLIGDSLGDADMADGLHYDNIIRVGYLNAHVDEQIDQYREAFDIVVLGDGCLEPVQNILEKIFANGTN